jgi:hypothetical protein
MRGFLNFQYILQLVLHGKTLVEHKGVLIHLWLIWRNVMILRLVDNWLSYRRWITMILLILMNISVHPWFYSLCLTLSKTFHCMSEATSSTIFSLDLIMILRNTLQWSSISCCISSFSLKVFLVPPWRIRGKDIRLVDFMISSARLMMIFWLSHYCVFAGVTSCLTIQWGRFLIRWFSRKLSSIMWGTRWFSRQTRLI